MYTRTSDRWVQVGSSTQVQAKAAGAEAARGAVGQDDPGLLIVFASFGYDLPELLAGVGEVAGTIPVIGCSTAGEIGPGPLPGAPVVVVGLGGRGFQIRTACATGLHERPRGVGEDVAAALLPLPDTQHRVAVLLTDALAGDQHEMIRGAYAMLGATVPLVGGGAGDNMRMRTSRQLFGGQVLQDAVVAAYIGSDSPLGIGIRHGWQRMTDAMVVTASAGNHLLTLDDKPALDVYLDLLGATEAEVLRDPATFTEFALVHPIAVARRGDDAVRHVLAADADRRALICAGTVPKGAATWLMSGDAASTLEAAGAACADAVTALDGADLLAMLVFDCVGRRSVLGEQGMLAERALMDQCAGPAPVAGFYTYGEIARIRGVNGFHNQTIVTLALS